MFQKIRTIAWFICRPTFWPHMWSLALRKFDGSMVHERFATAAKAWASERAVSVDEALDHLGLAKGAGQGSAQLDPGVLTAGEVRAAMSSVPMGGPGDLNLIYRSILAIKATRVIETGVAYGWSSLAALAALRQTNGRLVSVDMPYPKANNETFVGIVVPDDWRDRWTLIRQPDRNGVKQAIDAIDGTADLIHFDSDKSYAGRMFAFPLLWEALRPGGVFLSDDIQDNFGFRDFALSKSAKMAVTMSDGKFVGILRKPFVENR